MGPLDTLRPKYGEASLADIMPSVLTVLGVPGEHDALGLAAQLDGVRRVAVLLVDGLGWYQLPVAAPHAPTLADIVAGRLGSARPLTAGFPSTTPTSLVTLGTGRAPGAHGILGINLNIPGTGRALNQFEWLDEPDPATWQPEATAFSRAAAAGLAATVVNRAALFDTGLSRSAYRGARFSPGTLADEIATAMLAALATSDLVYGYIPDVDKAGHEYGIDSGPWRAAASAVDGLLSRLVDGLSSDTALLVTADHGQLNVPAGGRVDLDLDPRLRAGVAMVTGEARVRYLHTLPGARDDVLATWRAVLGPDAWVLTREEAVAEGWFGPVRAEHLERVGDVVAVCRGELTVVASRSEPERVARFVAYHGSCTATEMQIPLLVVRGTG